MNFSKFWAAYIFSIALIPFFIFGIFHSEFLTADEKVLSFYIQLSSVFMLTIIFLLSWYYSNNLIRSFTLSNMLNFAKNAMDIDINKISSSNLKNLSENYVSKLRDIEDYKFELFGFAIPLFISFLTTTSFLMYLNIYLILPLILTSFIGTIIIITAVKLIKICDIRQYNIKFDENIKNIISSSRGIQYYSAYNFVTDNLESEQKLLKNLTKKLLSKIIWRSFFYVSCLFCFICIIYALKEDYIANNLLDISGNSTLFFSCVFFYIMFLVSILRYIKIRNIKLDSLEKYKIENFTDSKNKKLSDENLFIALHEIYFQNPTEFSDSPILDGISFSVLPGEFIAITGENFKNSRYIFDLILKYYKPQSGNIYISGSDIKGIETESLRSLIGIFKEDFGLIKGTVHDNLRLLTENERQINAVSEKVELYDEELNLEIFNSDGNIQIPQEILFRIQMARISIQKPRILLIESPDGFESEREMHMFNNLVEHMSQRKTVIISTTNPEFIIYSDKTLYMLENGKSLFGTHAELSKNQTYQRYIKNFKINKH